MTCWLASCSSSSARREKRAKVLFWDGTGLVIYAKRLERGCFSAPWRGDGIPLQMTETELALFLEGSKLAGKVQLSPAEFALGTVFGRPHQRR